ncbi:MAG: sulfatase-like hydrolase/transferase, partial [Rhodospirillaceae bacterium]
MSRVWISLSLAVLLAASVLAVREAVRTPPVNVIVLTVESWRADAATPARMPNLFAEAARGVTFNNHRDISAWTAPNVVAVLTGISPFRQGIHARGQSIPEEYDLFPERLAEQGWDVGGLQAFMLIDVFANLGFSYEPGADLMNWISIRARAQQPFMVWYHYLDTHLPYNPRRADEILKGHPAVSAGAAARQAEVRKLPVIPEGELDFAESDRPWIEALYDAGFEDFDDWFGGFWAFYEVSGLIDNTILVVTADHGEELLERGNVGHASTTRAGHMHGELVRVPLFVWAPEEVLPVAAGTVVADMTDHLMITPALVDMLGLKHPPDTDSTGLFAEPRRSVWSGLTSRAGFSEPDPADVTRFHAAMRDGDLKVQVSVARGSAPKVEVWDLADDPGELAQLNDPPARAQAMAATLLDRLSAMRRPEGMPPDGAGAPAAAPPDWVHPPSGGVVGYRDIEGQSYLEWTGEGATPYVIEYEAGSGLLSLSGTIETVGPRYDFGAVSERYWATWVVPYGRVRFRVR